MPAVQVKSKIPFIEPKVITRLPSKITCDTREPEYFQDALDDIRELAYGDFEIVAGSDQILAERKTHADLWNSLRNKRLDRQVFDLSKQQVRYCLIIEKSYMPPFARGALYAAFMKVNKLAWSFPIIHTLNQSHTVKELRNMERRLAEGRLHTITRPIEHDDISDPRIGMLARIPGMGPRKAQAALKRYGSVAKALAKVDEWDDKKNGIPGVGPKIKEQAKKVLH